MVPKYGEEVRRPKGLSNRKLLDGPLRHAQKMEVLGQMAAGVAHDFNNLLAAILGYTDEILEIQTTAEVRLRVDEIRKAAELGHRLTQQLTILARREVPGEPQVIDVNDSVTELSPILEQLVGKKVRIVLNLSARNPVILIDQCVLDQLLINLVVNAGHAMTHAGGGDVVRIKTRNATRKIGPGVVKHVVIEVIDRGDGMTADVRARIFEPFFTTKGVGHGTGLGLSIVAAIVHQAGGHIDVASRVGRGTTFRVWLPLPPTR